MNGPASHRNPHSHINCLSTIRSWNSKLWPSAATNHLGTHSPRTDGSSLVVRGCPLTRARCEWYTAQGRSTWCRHDVDLFGSVVKSVLCVHFCNTALLNARGNYPAICWWTFQKTRSSLSSFAAIFFSYHWEYYYWNERPSTTLPPSYDLANHLHAMNPSPLYLRLNWIASSENRLTGIKSGWLL